MSEERKTSAARGVADGLSDPANGGFEGSSEAVRALRGRLAAALATGVPLFLWGESGTGKDRAARLLQRLGPGASAPFVRLGPEGGWPDDPLGAAAGGTLYLDGPSALPADLQTRLVGHLQAAETSPAPDTTRLVAADSTDPRLLHRQGALRDDLFFRLHVLPVPLPPLRDRAPDFAVLATTLLAEHGAVLDPEAAEGLARYRWPGNVRELENLLKAAVAMAAPVKTSAPATGVPLRLTAEHIPPGFGTDEGLVNDPLDAFAGRTLAEIERRAIEDALRRAAGSVTRAARALGVAPSTIYRKMEGWGTPLGQG